MFVRQNRLAAIARRSSLVVAVILVAAISLAAEKPKKALAPAKPAAKAQPAKGQPAAKPQPAAASTGDTSKLGSNAPVTNPAWSHAPFESGDCSICHVNKDPKNPGKLTMPVEELCLGCHDQIADLVKGHSAKHKPAQENCVYCHNAHNAPEKKLLKQKPPALCYGCHDKIQAEATKGKVKHDALTMGEGCANCHNAHGSDVEHLLISLPYDLCVNCHSKDDIPDHDGKKLTNFGKLLAENPVKHEPVAGKDCSACHTPHGSNNFRLLKEEYPAKFYSPYDPKNYALCYSCHNDQILAQPKTTTLTGFRDGDRNLHYVHVNKKSSGRTCRACHEVHASKQPHQIRDAVPFGPSSWLLKVNYKQLSDGGQCEKTCHATKRYINGEAKAAPVKK